MPDNPVISQIKISEGSTDVTYDVKDTKARSSAIQFATCSTAAATGTKVVECSDFALANEAKILVKFDNTNSASVSNLKLNVNGTGAKAVRYRGANLPQPGLIKAGGLYLFVYTDNLYWNIIGDLDTVGDGMFATCSTSADVATKEVTIDNFNNTEGAVIFVKFTNTNTATGTLYLKVNGSSSRMKYRSSDLATSGIIIANSIHAFVKTSSYWYLVGELYQHPSYTARTGKPTENLTPSFGDTVTISQITSDATGHVTAATDRTIKIPNDTYSYNSSGYGTKGLVPAPSSSDSGKYLQAGSGWASLPTAGLNTAGIVKLSSSTSDTSTTAAATASAVKSAYDLANGKSTVSFTQTLSSGTKIGSISINGSSTDIYCSTDTDKQVHVKKATTTKAYLMGTSTTPTTSNQQTTALADTGVYLTTTAGELQATNFVGKINGFDIGMSVPSGSALTDTKVTQSNSTGNTNRPLMLSHDGTGTTSDVTDVLYRNANMYGNPSTGTIYGNAFYANNGSVTIRRSSSISDNYPATLNFVTYQTDTPITTSQASIKVYDDHDNQSYGQNMIIRSGGNIVIGSGESPDTIYSSYINGVNNSDGAENLWLSSDYAMKFNLGFDDNPSGSVSGADSIQYIMTKTSFYQNMIDSSTNVEGFGFIGTKQYRWNAGNFHHVNVVTGVHCNDDRVPLGQAPLIYLNQSNLWIGARFGEDLTTSTGDEYKAAHHPGGTYISTGCEYNADKTLASSYETIKIAVPYQTTKNGQTIISSTAYDAWHSGYVFRDITSNTDNWSTVSVPLSSNSTFKVLKADNTTIPSWAGSTKYENGIVFGSGTSKGLMSISRSTPSITFAGGASTSTQTKPEWYINLTGTNGSTYNLDILRHSKRFATSSNGQDNGWSTIVTADGIAKLQDSVTSALYVTRHTPVSGTTAYDPPAWYAAKHSVGLMFANQNQVAIMSMASNNSVPLIKFGATGGGPNGTPVADGTGPANPGTGVGWYFGLTGTTATTYNLDSFSTTDTKVTQTISTGAANYGILMSYTNSDSTATEGARKASGFYYNPGKGVMTVPTLKLTHTNTDQLLNSLNIRIEPNVIFDYDKLLVFSDYDDHSASIHLVPFSDGTSSIGYSGIHWASSYINTMNGELNGSISSSTTATTQSIGDNSTKVATTAYVDTTVSNLVTTFSAAETKVSWEGALGIDRTKDYLRVYRGTYTSDTGQAWMAGQQAIGTFIKKGDKAAMISFNANYTGSKPRVSFAASKSATTASDGPTATNGWYFRLAGTDETDYDLDAIRTNQAGQVYDQATSMLCIPFFYKGPNSMTASEKVYYTTGFCTQYRTGASSSSPKPETDGCNILSLGNNITSGTAGNAFGAVCMWSRLTQAIQLRPNRTSSWINIALPAKSTTSVVMTQIIMYEWSSGTKLDTYTSDAYSSQEFAYFKVFIENSTGSCFCSYDVLYNGSTTLNEFGLVWGKTTTGDGTTKCSTIMIKVSKSNSTYTFTATTAPGYQGSTSVAKPTVYIRKVIGVICQKYDP